MASFTYNRSNRSLAIRAQITCADGTVYALNQSDIQSYTRDVSCSSEGLILGGTEAASFTLNVRKTLGFTPKKLDNAEVHVSVGILTNGEIAYTDAGVWYVHDVDTPEQSTVISLIGEDALSTRFEAEFNDTGRYPTTVGSIAQFCSAASDIPMKSYAFLNASAAVSKKPEWPEGCTVRDVLGWCAACAGGFARIAPDGKLEIRSYTDGESYEMTPGEYRAFTPHGGKEFTFNCIEWEHDDDSETENKRFAVNAAITSDATNTIQISNHPFITQAMIQAIVSELSGFSVSSADVDWMGDPALLPGDFVSVANLKGKRFSLMVTSASLNFDGGISGSFSSAMPSINTVGGSTYSTAGSLYDSSGKLQANRIPGLDKSVITATTGHFQNLTAETIMTDKLTAALIEAINLRAGKIEADEVVTDSLTATITKIIEATIKKLNAGTITTDELFAAFAEIVALKVGTLTAESIETDKLAAALATFTVITAGSASFDQATIKHLVAEALNLEFGTANEVFIRNLSVEYAQIVNATVGNLCIKASDGKYYTLDVDELGNVTAVERDVTAPEIESGSTNDNRPIVDTNITAGSLNTSNLLATYALINKIDAARIDVDELFAREAFIKALTTSRIFADGGTLEIIAQAANEVGKWFKFDNERGLIIRKPEYTDDFGIFHPASIWYTVTDETGYHIYNTEQTAPLGSFQRGGLKTTGVTIGEIRAKATGTGGWVFTDPE
jgi:hypothetical protein